MSREDPRGISNDGFRFHEVFKASGEHSQLYNIYWVF